MKRALSLFLACAMTFSLAACGSKAGTEAPAADAQTESAEAGTVFKIGGSGPVTGGAAIYGLAVQHGAEIAVAEINEAGGIGGVPVEFNFQDDEHDPEKAVNAYNALKDWGMQMMMGTTTSGPCIAVAEKTNGDNIFQITPSGTAPECVQYENAYRMCFSDPSQGLESAKYIGENGMAAKVAVIYDNSDVYSSGIFDAFQAEAANQSFEIVSAEAFNADNKTDFSVQVQKAKDAGADLLFMPIYYTEASLILAECKKQSFAPTFFGCDGMDGILTMENFDAALAEGLTFLAPFVAKSEDEAVVNFVSKFEKAYGETPNQFAADAYDSIYVIKAALEAAGATPDMDASALCDAMKAAMPDVSYDGVTGKGITWTDGEPNKAPLVVKIVDGEYTAL